MEQAIIHLKRKPAYADSLSSYKIFIDGKQVGTIRNGKSCSFEISPGRHDIFLTIDWCSSQHLSLDIAIGEQVKLVCQGRNPLLALYYVTFGAQHHIKLHHE